jgi:hypothetical protein
MVWVGSNKPIVMLVLPMSTASKRIAITPDESASRQIGRSAIGKSVVGRSAIGKSVVGKQVASR